MLTKRREKYSNDLLVVYILLLTFILPPNVDGVEDVDYVDLKWDVFVPNKEVDQAIVCNKDIGIYTFSPRDWERLPFPDDPNHYYLNHPYIAGTSYWVNWAEIEPEEGKFQWDYIDNMVAAAKKVNKKVNLHIVNNITPEWVFEAGAQYVWKYYGMTTDIKLKHPVYWDPVYLQKLENMVRALGARYDTEPTVYAVGIAGGGAQEEIHIVPNMRNPLNKKILKIYKTKYGFTYEKAVEMWKRIVNFYAEAFPSKRLYIDAWPITKQGDMEGRRAMDKFYQWLVDTYGMRCMLIRYILTEKTYNRLFEPIRSAKHGSYWPYYAIIFNRYKDETLLAMQGAAPQFAGDREKAYIAGLTYQMTFFEIHVTEFPYDRQIAKKNEVYYKQVKQLGGPDPELEKNLEFLARYIGYQIILQKITLHAGPKPYVNLEWYNRGAAPLKREKRIGKKGMVASYGIEISIYHNNSLLYNEIHIPPIPTNKWHANDSISYRHSLPIMLKKETLYRVEVSIVNPENNSERIRLVNGNKEKDNYIWCKNIMAQ